LSPPGKWLDVGENGYLTNGYLAELCATARAKLFVSYATGGADWYPDHLSFMFSRRNPARTALLTAHWELPDALRTLLESHECRYHYGQALEVFSDRGQGDIEIRPAAETLSPLNLYRAAYGEPPFMKGRGAV
jgi:hypothetical protein